MFIRGSVKKSVAFLVDISVERDEDKPLSDKKTLKRKEKMSILGISEMQEYAKTFTECFFPSYLKQFLKIIAKIRLLV